MSCRLCLRSAGSGLRPGPRLRDFGAKITLAQVIDHLPMSYAISIEQKTTLRNPRSTVGTVTEIYDYLRLLFARVGWPHCYPCYLPIETQSLQQIVDSVRSEYYAVTERSVDVQIVGLRRKLGRAAHSIETVRGVGYRLRAL